MIRLSVLNLLLLVVVLTVWTATAAAAIPQRQAAHRKQPDPAPSTSAHDNNVNSITVLIEDLPYQALRLVAPEAVFHYLLKEHHLFHRHLPESVDPFASLERQLLRRTDPESASRYQRLERCMGRWESVQLTDLRLLLLRRAAPQEAAQLRYLQSLFLSRVDPGAARELRALRDRLLVVYAADIADSIGKLQDKCRNQVQVEADSLISSLSRELNRDLTMKAAFLLDELDHSHPDPLMTRIGLAVVRTGRRSASLTGMAFTSAVQIVRLSASMARTAYASAARSLFARDDALGHVALAIWSLVMMMDISLLCALKSAPVSGTLIVAHVGLIHIYYQIRRRQLMDTIQIRHLTIKVAVLTIFLMILIPLKFFRLEIDTEHQ